MFTKFILDNRLEKGLGSQLEIYHEQDVGLLLNASIRVIFMKPGGLAASPSSMSGSAPG